MKHWTIHLTVAIACGWTSWVSAAERPNILLIVSEDNGPELGCYVDPFVKTPVLDKLASIGLGQLIQRLCCGVQPSSDDRLCDAICLVFADSCPMCHKQAVGKL